jgi:hypothetical protein
MAERSGSSTWAMVDGRGDGRRGRGGCVDGVVEHGRSTVDVAKRDASESGDRLTGNGHHRRAVAACSTVHHHRIHPTHHTPHSFHMDTSHPSSPTMQSLLPLSSSFFRSPFTRQSLHSIAQHLAIPVHKQRHPPEWTPVPPRRKGSRGEAAVLIPLVNLIDHKDQSSGKLESGMLLQLRPGGMRMHGGEVR